jgi:hypothetical protein
MGMRHRALRAGLALTGLGLVAMVLAGCTATASPGATAPPSSSSTDSVQAGQSDDPDTTWNGLSAPLGQTATFDSGLAVLVAAPTRWRPHLTATGVDPHGTTVSMAVTLTNGQTQAFDATGLTADAFVGTGASTPCTKVQDRVAGVWSVRPTSIGAGGSGRLVLGYSCPGPSGMPLVVDVTPQVGFASAQFSGTLP